MVYRFQVTRRVLTLRESTCKSVSALKLLHCPICAAKNVTKECRALVRLEHHLQTIHNLRSTDASQQAHTSVAQESGFDLEPDPQRTVKVGEPNPNCCRRVGNIYVHEAYFDIEHSRNPKGGSGFGIEMSYYLPEEGIAYSHLVRPPQGTTTTTRAFEVHHISLSTLVSAPDLCSVMETISSHFFNSWFFVCGCADVLCSLVLSS